jgi:hypothetical protein
VYSISSMFAESSKVGIFLKQVYIALNYCSYSGRKLAIVYFHSAFSFQSTFSFHGAFIFIHGALFFLHSAFLFLHSALFKFSKCESALVYFLQV